MKVKGKGSNTDFKLYEYFWGGVHILFTLKLKISATSIQFKGFIHITHFSCLFYFKSHTLLFVDGYVSKNYWVFNRSSVHCSCLYSGVVFLLGYRERMFS